MPETRGGPVIIVDDERAGRHALALALQAHGIRDLRQVEDPRLLFELLEEGPADCVLLDLGLPGMPGEEVLARLSRERPDLPVIVVTARDEVEVAVRCLHLGASDYVVKPVDENRLLASLDRILSLREMSRVNEALRQAVLRDGPERPELFAGLVTRDPAMLAVFRYIEAVAPSAQPVLISGETGTGKELLARSVHDASGRAGPFVAVNIAGLDDQLFTDTLFGHRKGAFTGADQPRKGLIEQAAGGTLFLDEIGDLSLVSQAKLLRLVQEREYLPLGADLPRRSDARIVCATHRDLDALSRGGGFRRDLYFRLRAHHAVLPPLRDRRGDLPLLCRHLVAKAAAALGRPAPALPHDLARRLAAHPFSGNVRELEALLADAVSRTRGTELSLEGLPAAGLPAAGLPAAGLPAAGLPAAGLPAADGSGGFAAESAGEVSFGERLPGLDEVQDLLVAEALRRSGGNQAAAAALLGVSRQAVSKRVRQGRPNTGDGPT